MARSEARAEALACRRRQPTTRLDEGRGDGRLSAGPTSEAHHLPVSTLAWLVHPGCSACRNVVSDAASLVERARGGIRRGDARARGRRLRGAVASVASGEDDPDAEHEDTAQEPSTTPADEPTLETTMAHHHDHDSPRRLATVLAMTATYMVAEVVGGWWSGSLALLADAGHMFSDSLALIVALLAARLAQRPASPRRTFGDGRLQVLGAMVNASLLAVVAVGVVHEAVERFAAPVALDGPIALFVAVGGLVLNGVALWILHGGDGASLNERGAFLHVLGDALGSVGAILGTGLAWGLGLRWADPAASVLIALLVLRSAFLLMRETVHVLMEGAPAGLDVEAVERSLRGVDDVLSVHDLHVWTVDGQHSCLSVHVVTRGSGQQLLDRVQRHLAEEHDIDHATVQIEDSSYVEHCTTRCDGALA